MKNQYVYLIVLASAVLGTCSKTKKNVEQMEAQSGDSTNNVILQPWQIEKRLEIYYDELELQLLSKYGVDKQDLSRYMQMLIDNNDIQYPFVIQYDSGMRFKRVTYLEYRSYMRNHPIDSLTPAIIPFQAVESDSINEFLEVS